MVRFSCLMERPDGGSYQFIVSAKDKDSAVDEAMKENPESTGVIEVEDT